MVIVFAAYFFVAVAFTGANHRLHTAVENARQETEQAANQPSSQAKKQN
jgi:hypothetical protein